MRAKVLWACWVLPAVALGATATTRPTPAEELDAELAAQVKIPEPELVIVTDGPDPARFDLLEGTVELDGRPLAGPMEPGWGKPYYQGTVVPGNHVLTAQFSYRGTPDGGVSLERLVHLPRAGEGGVPGPARAAAGGPSPGRGARGAGRPAEPAGLPGGAGARDDRQGGRRADAAASAPEGDRRRTSSPRSSSRRRSPPRRRRPRLRRPRPRRSRSPRSRPASPPPAPRWTWPRRGCRRRSPPRRIRRRRSPRARAEKRRTARGRPLSMNRAGRTTGARRPASRGRPSSSLPAPASAPAAYLANSIVNSPLPWVAERRSVE